MLLAVLCLARLDHHGAVSRDPRWPGLHTPLHCEKNRVEQVSQDAEQDDSGPDRGDVRLALGVGQLVSEAVDVPGNSSE